MSQLRMPQRFVLEPAPPMISTIYRRDGHMKPQQIDVVDLGGGVGQIACLECGGSGRWAFMAPEIPEYDCVDCKGTGKRFIAFWPVPPEERIQ